VLNTESEVQEPALLILGECGNAENCRPTPHMLIGHFFFKLHKDSCEGIYPNHESVKTTNYLIVSACYTIKKALKISHEQSISIATQSS
jgi:hypothetical protein